jgi:hypothetical protein
MATVSFSKKASAVADEQPTTEAIAIREEKPLATPFRGDNDFGGAWSAKEDVKYPRIHLVHKTSNEELVTNFGIGSFVLNKEVKLSDGNTPLAVTAVYNQKDYIEKRPFGDPEQPDVCLTPQEVTAKGGTLNRKDVGSTLYIPRAHITFLVEAPADATADELALFPYTFGDKSYALALYTVSSSGYTSVGRDLATFRTQNKVMQKGLKYGKLELTSKTEKNAQNSWKVPVIRFVGENDADFVSFVDALNPNA